MHAHRRFGNRVLTVGMALLTRRKVTDGQSGYRALSPAAARNAEVIHDYNYAQVLTLDLVRKGYRYVEVPISYSFRTQGQSFVRLVPYLRHVVPAVWRQLRSHVDGPPVSIGSDGRGEDGDLSRRAGEGDRKARFGEAAARAGHSGFARLPDDRRGVRQSVLRSPEP
jgi:hypothetical protein